MTKLKKDNKVEELAKDFDSKLYFILRQLVNEVEGNREIKWGREMRAAVWDLPNISEILKKSNQRRIGTYD